MEDVQGIAAMIVPPDPGAQQPWDQQPGEPDRWFQRFCRYLYMGPRRSFLATYRTEWRERVQSGVGCPSLNSIPNTWQMAVVRWQWPERAAAWDRAERERLHAEYEADRHADRLARVRLLRAHRERLARAIEQLDPASASWTDVTNALRMLGEQARLEETGVLPSGPISSDDDLLDAESARAELAARLGAVEARRRESARVNATGPGAEQ